MRSDCSSIFKRLYWRYILQKKSEDELVKMLKKPDNDVADLLWKYYVRQVRDIRDLMVIVYDDNHEFHKTTRLIAGETVLVVLKQALGGEFLPGIKWTCSENGRLAYLIGVGLYLPKLRSIANSIVKNYFYHHERLAFAGAW